MIFDRLSPEGREVLRLAAHERAGLDHPCLADEHLLLGLLRHRTSDAAALLHSYGLECDAVRADLLRIGPSMDARANPATALRALGIDAEDIRRRLTDSFGPAAVATAERRVRRRPRRRGGHPRPSPLCAYLVAKRALAYAARFADEQGDAAIGPGHLLYGILRDARDPLGTQLSRRSRRQLTALGWTPGRTNPVRTLLDARGIDLGRLAAQLGGTA